MLLIYRGETFEYTPNRPKAIRKPRAVNWRYRVSEKLSDDVESTTTMYSRAGVVNWRWQS
ncbi:MAG TPA: hypothetical protein V6C78_05915 [Crinalium sp.]|jgi:hypothetical protein